MAIAAMPLTLLAQEPFVIAAGAIRSCEVPIRTVATSMSVLLFPDPLPIWADFLFLLYAFTAIKFKPVKPNK